jgi:hypothetical protein
LYGPPCDCKQNLWTGWIGLRKCIRPDCGAKPLAMMESARRWSTKWVELGWFLFPHRLEQRQLRPFLSLIDLSCKPEGVESIPAAPGLKSGNRALSAGFPNFVGKSFFDFSMKWLFQTWASRNFQVGSAIANALAQNGPCDPRHLLANATTTTLR